MSPMPSLAQEHAGENTSGDKSLKGSEKGLQLFHGGNVDEFLKVILASGFGGWVRSQEPSAFPG